MIALSDAAPWLSVGLLIGSVLLLLHRPLGKLLKLLFRSSAALGLLAALQHLALPGIALGANPVNALVLGALGMPGFGLLLMLQWISKI